jgi:membrane associated rhomboid family serine protease
MYFQKAGQSSQRIARGGWLNDRRVVQINWQALGASGAVMGMGSAAAFLSPFAPIAVMFIPMPLWVATIGYVAADTYFLNSERSKVGHAAHLGGFVFGVAYYASCLRNYGGVWSLIRHGLRR